ncbi:MAG: hypothetical protein ABIP63_07485, partial [Thermoanaerobaculia bacterium]
IIVAYTVPRQWSAILQRDRERQTIFAMRQYARACREWNKKHAGIYPTSITQLKDARSPRFMRGVKSEMIDPLTGQVDWLIIPQAAATQQGAPGVPGPGNRPPIGGTAPTTSTGPTTQPGVGQPTLPNGQPATQAKPGVPMKDYAGGPFVGVRPPKTGKSMLQLKDADTYETWMFTALDLEQEIAARMAAMNNPWK